MATKDSKPKTKSKAKTKTKKKPTTKKKAVVKKETIKNNTHKSDTMAKEDNKLMLFIAYFIGIWAIIIYLIKKDDSFVKFHCLQSIVLNIVAFVLIVAIMVFGSVFTMVLGALTAGIGGLCGIVLFPLSMLPMVYYLYVFYKVLTTGDIEVPYITEFVKKSLKKYY
jgi:uncharacterized membrane protein